MPCGFSSFIFSHFCDGPLATLSGSSCTGQPEHQLEARSMEHGADAAQRAVIYSPEYMYLYCVQPTECIPLGMGRGLSKMDYARLARRHLLMNFTGLAW